MNNSSGLYSYIHGSSQQGLDGKEILELNWERPRSELNGVHGDLSILMFGRNTVGFFWYCSFGVFAELNLSLNVKAVIVEHSRKKWGKRKPLIQLGSCLWASFYIYILEKTRFSFILWYKILPPLSSYSLMQNSGVSEVKGTQFRTLFLMLIISLSCFHKTL